MLQASRSQWRALVGLVVNLVRIDQGTCGNRLQKWLLLMCFDAARKLGAEARLDVRLESHLFAAHTSPESSICTSRWEGRHSGRQRTPQEEIILYDEESAQRYVNRD